MSREERKAMIRRDIPGLSLSRQCEILSISRSSFYYTPKGESAENLALMRRIDELFSKYSFYGSRQMVGQLQRDGIIVGRHRVRRLMLTSIDHDNQQLGRYKVTRYDRCADPFLSVICIAATVVF